MKNKDKYLLTELSIKPKYMIDGCGRKVTKRYRLDIIYRDKVIAKNIIANDNPYTELMKWLEEESP